MPWESRFQVCDPVCGLVDAYPYKREAMARGKEARYGMRLRDGLRPDGPARGCQQLERTRRNDRFQAVGRPARKGRVMRRAASEGNMERELQHVDQRPQQALGCRTPARCSTR